jgi:hypothetical protein
MVADELRRQADHFVELQELGETIARHHQPRPYQEEDVDDGDDGEDYEDDLDEDDEAYVETV